jgi:hypothetical protein
VPYLPDGSIIEPRQKGGAVRLLPLGGGRAVVMRSPGEMLCPSAWISTPGVGPQSIVYLWCRAWAPINSWDAKASSRTT